MGAAPPSPELQPDEPCSPDFGVTPASQNHGSASQNRGGAMQLSHSAARLRLHAITASTLCFFAACILPAVSYFYIFRLDNLVLGPQAWAHWAVAFIASLLGIVAHGTASNALTAAHAALGGMLAAALGGYNTAFWFALDLRCQAVLALDPADAICVAALTQHTKYILAFTGLTTIVFLAVPVAYSLLALGRSEASRALRAAKHQTVCFAVDTQTSLIVAGEKPSVTPALLADWVQYLMDLADLHGEEGCGVIAEKCREALAARGYSLPVKARDGPGLLAAGGSIVADGPLTINVTAAESPGVTFFVGPQGSPAAGKPPRRPQVAADNSPPQRLPSTTVYPASGERLQAAVLGYQ